MARHQFRRRPTPGSLRRKNMATSPEMTKVEIENRQQLATRVTSALAKIHQLLEDKEFAKLVPYLVRKHGQNDKDRLEKVLQFPGPDKDTIEVLDANHVQWLLNPSTFWSPPSSVMAYPIDPLAQISRIILRASCILLLEFRARFKLSSVEETAAALHPFGSVDLPLAKLTRVLHSMIDEGHRYRNIEKELGAGSFFVLGKEIGETTWTKVLPKSGPTFSKAMDRMKSVGIPALAETYKELSKQVVEHELSLLVCGTTAMPVPEPSPLGLMSDASISTFSAPTGAMGQDMNEMMSFEAFSNDELSDILGVNVHQSEFSYQ